MSRLTEVSTQKIQVNRLIFANLNCETIPLLTGQVADEDEPPLAADGHGVRVVAARPHDGGRVLCLEVDDPRPGWST